MIKLKKGHLPVMFFIGCALLLTVAVFFLPALNPELRQDTPDFYVDYEAKEVGAARTQGRIRLDTMMYLLNKVNKKCNQCMVINDSVPNPETLLTIRRSDRPGSKVLFEQAVTNNVQHKGRLNFQIDQSNEIGIPEETRSIVVIDFEYLFSMIQYLESN